MDSTIYAAVIGALSGLLGALIAIRSTESRARKEMELRLRIAKDDLDAQLAIVKSEQQNKFKLVSLDKRLSTYQEAYSHLVNLSWHLFEQDVKEVASDFRQWLVKHNLYLDDQTRELLSTIINESPELRNFGETKRKEILDRIDCAIISITSAVDLAFIPDESTKPPE